MQPLSSNERNSLIRTGELVTRSRFAQAIGTMGVVLLMNNDPPNQTKLPTPKRGAIPTPKEEIERAPKYKPHLDQEQDKPPKGPDGDNDRQVRPETPGSS
jgi:hypothetical protein